MAVLATILGIASGICFGTGAIFLFTGFRRPNLDKTYILFGLFGLAYSGAILTGLLAYKATSLESYIVISRWGGVFTGLTLVFLLWFIGAYTRVYPRYFLIGLSGAIILVVIAAVIRPNFIHTELFGLNMVTLPWGESIALLDASESIWSNLFFLAEISLIGYWIFAILRQYRGEERQEALVLGVGLLFLMFALVFDLLYIDTNTLNFIYLGDFGFLPLLVVMSLQMSNYLIRTEEELQVYRQELESLVDERTDDLQKANEQLAQEIEERSRAQTALRQRVEELDFLKGISSTLAMLDVLPRTLQNACKMITQHFKARNTLIILPGYGKDAGMKLVGYDRKQGAIDELDLTVPLGDLPVARRVMMDGHSETISDVQSLSLGPEIGEFVKSQDIKFVLLVPLSLLGEITGLLVINRDREAEPFSKDEISLAEAIAGDVAGAIESSWLQHQEVTTAAAEERSRLARDLHDAVTQTIYSASLIVEVLPQIWARNPEEGARDLVKLRALVRGALAEMRTLLFELRPDALETANLVTLLRQLGDALTGRSRIPVELDIEAEGDPPVAVKVAVYRIAQEIFNNIAKHSTATQVIAALIAQQEKVILEIADNGKGFDQRSIPPGRLGMRIMQERATKVGATLAIISSPNHGTKVTFTWRAGLKQR